MNELERFSGAYYTWGNQPDATTAHHHPIASGYTTPLTPVDLATRIRIWLFIGLHLPQLPRLFPRPDDVPLRHLNRSDQFA